MHGTEFKVATLTSIGDRSVTLERSDSNSALPERLTRRSTALADLLAKGWKIQSTNVTADHAIIIVDTLVYVTPGASIIDY